MILCISVLSVVISPFSILILMIWFFSLCFLMRLANGLSILFIFSKNQLLALLIFAMVSFVSFAFFSALVFKICFLLLKLWFFISSFLVALGVQLVYLFDFFLVSWSKPVLLWTFALTLLLHCPISFGLVVFTFSFVSMHILISFFLFPLWFVGYSAAHCSASICWNF